MRSTADINKLLPTISRRALPVAIEWTPVILATLATQRLPEESMAAIPPPKDLEAHFEIFLKREEKQQRPQPEACKWLLEGGARPLTLYSTCLSLSAVLDCCEGHEQQARWVIKI
jgi:hypothetical protein